MIDFEKMAKAFGVHEDLKECEAMSEKLIGMAEELKARLHVLELRKKRLDKEIEEL